MSAHWMAEGITLFTAVLTSNGSSSSVVREEFRHEKYAVIALNRAILSACSDEMKEFRVFSDGAGSQFKNCFSP